ncbi:MAG: hypothetical protein HRF49_03900 [bacterium]|jgi:hypothetical protein
MDPAVRVTDTGGPLPGFDIYTWTDSLTIVSGYLIVNDGATTQCNTIQADLLAQMGKQCTIVSSSAVTLAQMNGYSVVIWVCPYTGNFPIDSTEATKIIGYMSGGTSPRRNLMLFTTYMYSATSSLTTDQQNVMRRCVGINDPYGYFYYPSLFTTSYNYGSPTYIPWLSPYYWPSGAGTGAGDGPAGLCYGIPPGGTSTNYLAYIYVYSLYQQPGFLNWGPIAYTWTPGAYPYWNSIYTSYASISRYTYSGWTPNNCVWVGTGNWETRQTDERRKFLHNALYRMNGNSIPN